MPSTSSLPMPKVLPLSLHSINSSKISTRLGNCTKLSLGDGQKREGERRKRKVLRCLGSRIYFWRDNDYLFSKKKKADFILESVFLLIDFSRGNLGRVRLAIMILFSKIGGEVSGDFVFSL